LAQLSRSSRIRNLAHRFRSFMAIDRQVSARSRLWRDAGEEAANW
jgi:hypothetical protein